MHRPGEPARNAAHSAAGGSEIGNQATPERFAQASQKSEIRNQKFLHFLAYDPTCVHNPRAPYAVLPAPYERTVSFGRGTERAPAAILAASVHIEHFDEELFQPLGLGVQTLPAVDCRRGTDRQVLEVIRRAAAGVMQRGQFLLTLGGEHTITFPLVAAAKAMHGDLTVLHFDAHLDLRDHYTRTPLSHGCVMRRVMELGVPIVSVGIRSVCAEEYRLVKQHRLPVFWARDIVQARSEAWMKAVLARLGKRVYISIDVDCLDPSLMPGTGTPEPGGLGWYALSGLLRRVCAARRVVAADLVEVAPVPGTPACEYIAARLAAKLMLYHRVGMGRQTATEANAQRSTPNIERRTRNP
ncbi:MAG: agmatinase [Verrucomicrobia bacterium]|nr:agmatinase [Verrucomicrobiota bacterium]